MEWQPIETAPKDRELILSPGGLEESSFIDAVKIGGWVKHDGNSISGKWEIWGASWEPKYWMPKPRAPDAKGEMCFNCGTELPEGCGGLFKDDGDECLHNTQ